MSVQIRKICSDLYTFIEKEDSLKSYRDLFCAKNINEIALELIENEPTLCGIFEAENVKYHFEMKIGHFRPNKDNAHVTQKITTIREKALAALRKDRACTSRKSKMHPSPSLSAQESEEVKSSLSSQSIPRHAALPAPSRKSSTPLKISPQNQTPPALEGDKQPSPSPDHTRLMHLHEQQREASYALEARLTTLQSKLEGHGLQIDTLKVANLALTKANKEREVSIQAIESANLALKTKLLQAAMLLQQLHKRNKELVTELTSQAITAALADQESAEAKEALSTLEREFETRFLAMQESYEAQMAPVNAAIAKLGHDLGSLQVAYQSQLEENTKLWHGVEVAAAEIRKNTKLSQEQEALLDSLNQTLVAKEKASAALQREIGSLKQALTLLPAKHQEELEEVRRSLAKEFEALLGKTEKAHVCQLEELQATEEARVAAKVETATVTLRRDHESALRAVKADAEREITSIRQDHDKKMRILSAQRETTATATVIPPAARKPKPQLDSVNSIISIGISEDPFLAPSTRELERLRRSAAAATLCAKAHIHQLEQDNKNLLEGNKALASRLIAACHVIDLQKKEMEKLVGTKEEPPSWRELATFAAKYALGFH